MDTQLKQTIKNSLRQAVREFFEPSIVLLQAIGVLLTRDGNRA